MDPQACFDRILALVGAVPTDHDRDELLELFSSLYLWLEEGGFPPRVTTLGVGLVSRWNGLPERADLRWIGTPQRTCRQSYAIMDDNGGGYVFVAYDAQGGELKRWQLAQSSPLPRTAEGDMGQVLEHLEEPEEPEDSRVTFPPAVDPLARMEE